MTNERLQLFVSGINARTEKLERSVRDVCEQVFPVGFELTVINVFENFELAEQRDVFATPTLFKLTEPGCRIVGDLTDKSHLLSCLVGSTGEASTTGMVH
ncbi:MAG: circadian clock protein KaiB [Gammaproteobacteria bacterium]|nr:MAG: circadian clock protein KaiB [Gammaproteobacteria bacterium]